MPVGSIVSIVSLSGAAARTGEGKEKEGKRCEEMGI